MAAALRPDGRGYVGVGILGRLGFWAAFDQPQSFEHSKKFFRGTHNESCLRQTFGIINSAMKAVSLGFVPNEKAFSGLMPRPNYQLLRRHHRTMLHQPQRQPAIFRKASS
jgi:hypothetical protein